MRILHVSDLHARESQLRWVVNESKEYDLVCISGDLLDLNAYRRFDGQIERTVAALKDIRVPLALCSGNHDSLAGEGAKLEDARWLRDLKGEMCWVDDDRFEFGGQQFRCVPWLAPVDPADENEIWLIHSPPDLLPTGITRGGVGWGDFSFGELCRNESGPKLALSGHIHDPQSWRARIGRTWSLNPGTGEGKTPPYITIDLGRGIAIRQHEDEIDAVRLWSV